MICREEEKFDEIENLIAKVKFVSDEEIVNREEDLNTLARMIDARLQDVDVGRS